MPDFTIVELPFLAPYHFAGNENEVKVSGTTESTLKWHRVSIVKELNAKTMVVVLEVKVSGGTGTYKIYLDGTFVGEVETTSTAYEFKKVKVDISNISEGIHTVEVKALNSGDYDTYLRTYDLYILPYKV